MAAPGRDPLLSVLTANGLQTQSMHTLTARPALRWLVPLVVLLVVLATYLVGARASAEGSLPKIEPEALLAKVADAKVDGLSGTVVQTADLGIPPIPGGAGGAGGELTGLLAGNHTLKVWYGAPDQSRLAVVSDKYGETDVIRNGADVWTWDSKTRKATHTALDSSATADRKAPAGAPQTPEDLAKTVIDKLDPTTVLGRPVSTTNVAGQPAYELVLTPKDRTSKITQVRIAVDGTTFVPLRVQIFGSGDKPALDVAYSTIDYARPEASNFRFTPARGETVEEKAAPQHQPLSKAQKKELEARKAQADQDTRTVGNGWTSVVITKLPSDAPGSNETLTNYLTKLPTIKGSWGTGHVLEGTIVTAILTDDGRLAVGAVSPEAVSAALGR